MNWLAWQTVAQISIERILNALPEGMLVAVFAWALLRVSRKQNSGTRFAVWFLALLGVAALPVLGGFGGGRMVLAAGMSSGNAWGSLRPAISIPASWGLLAFVAWALGAGVGIVGLAAGLWRVGRLRRSCTPIVGADLDPAVRKTVEAIGASGAVTVSTSESVRVPAALGFFQRTIVLPAWALRELSAEDLNVILLHEFAHLRRWDDWTNLIQKIVRALFFFHPAVWWIDGRLSVEREMACDDAVLAQTANPHGYATCLVSLLEKSLAHRLSQRGLADKSWSMAQAAVHRAREASQRLARILDANRPVATRVWKPALAMVAAFSLGCLAVLPHAPQVVAFDRGVSATDSHPVYAAAVSPLSGGFATNGRLGVPARLDSLSVADGRGARRASKSKSVHDAARHQPAAPVAAVDARLDAVPLNSSPPRERLVQASANAEQEVVPQFQTLVFIQTTEYRISNASVWSVQVWRVMLVSPIRNPAGVPVASSI